MDLWAIIILESPVNLSPADPPKLLEKAAVLDWILKESELGSC